MVSEQFAFLSSCGFKVVEHWIVDAETLESKITEIQSNLNTVPVPTDGLVLAYNDRAFGISRGTTGHHPNHSIAFKWKDEVTYTTLKSVEWSASKTGLLNPVAVFVPVEIEGTTVQRASVHNLSVMRELGLGIGNSIGVIKANLIIPQVVECVEKTNDVPIPTQCPVCGHDTERKASDTAEFLYCTNPECAAKHIGAFERLALLLGGVGQSCEKEPEGNVSSLSLKSPPKIRELCVPMTAWAGLRQS